MLLYNQLRLLLKQLLINSYKCLKTGDGLRIGLFALALVSVLKQRESVKME